MRLAVVGAGGFVGTALCERLFFEPEHEVVPIIHGSGAAARLARLPLPLRIADVMDVGQLESAMTSCDAVVNCSRGDGVVMDRGLRNIVHAARASGVKRLVHISSISIYGSHPPPEAQSESARPCPDDAYGVWKAQQDEFLLKVHRSGINVILLCPGNIYGPFSAFITAVVDQLRRRLLVLVEEGTNPANAVHVNNVVEAILCALRSDTGWGERYFVNESERTTWRQVFDQLCEAAGLEPIVESVSREEVLAARLPAPPKPGLKDNLKILASGEFRRALSMFPPLGRLNELLYNQVSRVDPKYMAPLRARLARPTVIRKQQTGLRLDHRFVQEQLKPVFHSPEKIMKTLGYRPFSQRQGMATVRDWLRFAGG